MHLENTLHTFHIPVMGTGFTVDTPLKVAHLGIDSVVSIIDDELLEQMRKHHSLINSIPFSAIEATEPDARARRITAYLNLLHNLVNLRFESIRNEAFAPGSEITRYFELLPETSGLKQVYWKMLVTHGQTREELQDGLRKLMRPGAIDVNIMTKIDSSPNKAGLHGAALAYGDAHTALRGFAHSTLNSSLVLSAGLNPRLYSYLQEFEDFQYNEEGYARKRIILKVSDFRSACIQGKFLAKRGQWISEFRIESGLNCGGHAFATDGLLIGPILKEFVDGLEDLKSELLLLYQDAMKRANRPIFERVPDIALSVQGGVGSHREHDLLINHYKVRSVGWGSPFLLVPEAVNLDSETQQRLAEAREEQIVLSKSSPLGVPFHLLTTSTSERDRLKRIKAEQPGSPCYKKHLASNTEFTKLPICTASRRYQKMKIKQIQATVKDAEAREKAIQSVTEKVCLCVGLGNGSLINAGEKLYKGMEGVAVCPGPNLAYFSRIVSLKDMIGHIYGRTDILERKDRPNMFAKELSIYVSYWFEKVKEVRDEANDKQIQYLKLFRENLNNCVKYYQDAFSSETFEAYLGARFGAELERILIPVNRMTL